MQKAAYIKFKQPASRFALVGVFVSQGAQRRARRLSRGQRPAPTARPRSKRRSTKSFTPDAAKAVKVNATGMNADLHGTAQYRAAMVAVMAARAVAAANAR